MSKKILIAMPDLLLTQTDVVASCESRTRSDLVREAIRRYLDDFNRRKVAAETNGDEVQLLNRLWARTE